MALDCLLVGLPKLLPASRMPIPLTLGMTKPNQRQNHASNPPDQSQNPNGWNQHHAIPNPSPKAAASEFALSNTEAKRSRETTICGG